MSPLFKRRDKNIEKDPFDDKTSEEETKVIKKTILVEPFEVLIVENEKSVYDGRKWEIVQGGTIKVKNLSDSDLYSIAIKFNRKIPKIGDKIKIPFLGAKEEWETSYELKPSKPILDIKREISTESGKVIPIGKASKISIKVLLKNNIEKPLNTIECFISVPKDSSLESHTEENLMYSMHTNKIKLSAKKLLNEASFTGKISLLNVPETVSIGDLVCTFTLDDTLSGLNVSSATAKSTVDTHVIVDQDPSNPNIWNTVIELSNPNNYAVKLNGSIKIQGEIKQMQLNLPEGIELKGNVIEVSDLKIKGLGKEKIGPIPIESETMPSVEVQVSAIILGRIKKISKGEIRIAPETLETVGVKLGKAVKVIVDDVFSKLLNKDEIPSIIESYVQISCSAEILGKAQPNKIEFIEELPEIVTDIDGVNILVDGKRTKESSASHEYANNLLKTSIELNTKPKKIELTYKAKLNGIKAREPNYRFPSKVLVYAGDEVLEFELPPIETPKIKVKKMRANLSASHKIEKLDQPHTYKATIILENKGNAPVINKTVIVELPQNLELIETKPEASTTTKKNTTELRWNVDKVMPSSKIVITYIVRGKDEYSLDEIKRFKIT